jgi:hypothetical protein
VPHGAIGEVLGGCYARGKRASVGRWPGLARRNSFLFDLFKNFSNGIESICSKKGIPLLRKFQIEYGFEGN